MCSRIRSWLDALYNLSPCLRGIASASKLNIQIHVLARRSFLSRWIWNRTGFAASLIQWTTVRMSAAKSVREHLTVSLKNLTQPCCYLSSASFGTNCVDAFISFLLSIRETAHTTFGVGRNNGELKTRIAHQSKLSTCFAFVCPAAIRLYASTAFSNGTISIGGGFKTPISKPGRSSSAISPICCGVSP